MKKTVIFIFIIVIIASIAVLYWILQPQKTNSLSNNAGDDNSVTLMRKNQITAIVENWNENNYSEVIDLADTYLQDYPEDSYIRMLKGISLLNIAQLSSDSEYKRDIQSIWDAIHEIRQALIISPSFQYRNEAYYALGKAYYLLSGTQLQKSITYLETAIKENIGVSDVYDFLIAAYRDAKKYEQAISLVKERIQKSKTEAHTFELYLSLIDLYLETKNVNEASQNIIVASNLKLVEQQKLELRIREAELQLSKNNFDSAIATLTKVIEKDPLSYRAFYYLGIAYDKKGDIGKARYQWRQALSIRPVWDKVIEKLSETQE